MKDFHTTFDPTTAAVSFVIMIFIAIVCLSVAVAYAQPLDLEIYFAIAFVILVAQVAYLIARNV